MSRHTRAGTDAAWAKGWEWGQAPAHTGERVSAVPSGFGCGVPSAAVGTRDTGYPRPRYVARRAAVDRLSMNSSADARPWARDSGSPRLMQNGGARVASRKGRFVPRDVRTHRWPALVRVVDLHHLDRAMVRRSESGSGRVKAGGSNRILETQFHSDGPDNPAPRRYGNPRPAPALVQSEGVPGDGAGAAADRMTVEHCPGANAQRIVVVSTLPSRSWP